VSFAKAIILLLSVASPHVTAPFAASSTWKHSDGCVESVAVSLKKLANAQQANSTEFIL
jgi:hypothetical protein